MTTPSELLAIYSNLIQTSSYYKDILGIVSVKSAPFYAKGDGETDDTSAIEAAIEYAINNSIRLDFPSGNYKITKSINSLGVVNENKNACTIGGIIDGLSLKDSNGDIIYFEKEISNNVGKKVTPDVIFPNYLNTNSLSSLTNTTTGTDVDGDYYSSLEAANTSNLITCSINTEYHVKIKMKGTIQNSIQVNFHQSNGTYVSNLLAYVFTSGGYSLNNPTVKEYTISFTVPDNADIGKLGFVFSSFTGKNIKVYSCVTSKTSDLPFRNTNFIKNLPYKGVSIQHIKNDVSWLARSDLTFSNLYTEIKWIKDTFNIKALRIFLALDSGMSFDSSHVFTNFKSNTLSNLDNIFSICRYMDISIIPVLFIPVRTASGGGVNESMSRLVMTNTNVRNGYIDAMKQIISRYEHFENIVGWDLVNEAHYMLSADRAGEGVETYTMSQINVALEALYSAAKAITSKPLILSLGDGHESKAGLYTINLDLIDILDHHCYAVTAFNLFGNRTINKPIIVGEIGANLSLAFNTPSDFASINSTLIPRLYSWASRVMCAFVWEQYLIINASTQVSTGNSSLINDFKYQ